MTARKLTFWLFVLPICANCACDRGGSGAAPGTSAAPATSAAASASATGSAQNADEGAAIVAMIQSSQRQGIIDRKPAAYMRIWDREAVIIAARTEQADRYDHVLEFDKIRQAAEARSQGKPDAKLEFHYADTKVEIQGKRATVTWRLKVTWRDLQSEATGEELTAERFVLRKTAEGWRVVENRFWPLVLKDADQEQTFDPARWKELDAAVDQARRLRNEPKLLQALFDAWRLKEGLELARKRTTTFPKNADAWAWRARFADRLRRITETVDAFEKLKALDPKARIPGWVQAQLDKRPSP